MSGQSSMARIHRRLAASLLMASACGVSAEAALPDGEPPIIESPDAGGMAEDTPTFAITSFRDLGQSWASTMILRLARDEVVAGYSDGTFRPNARITRAEFAALLAKAFPSCAATRSPRVFADLPAGYWATGAVDKVYRCGIMSGDASGSFRPFDSTTRIETVVAIHSALQQQDSGVQRYFMSLEARGVAAVSADLRDAYFDADQVPSWARAALLSAHAAGMVVIGEDGSGVELGARRVLIPGAPVQRADVAALIFGARERARSPNGAGLTSPAPSASGFRAAPYTGAGLRDGEFVLTFDDGPRDTSAAIAATLRRKNAIGLFFTVTHGLGWIQDGGVHLRPDELDSFKAILDSGQVVGNHMHRHCIHGASCGGLGVAELSPSALRVELETAHRVIRAAVAESGYRPQDKFLHFFRAPGGITGTSWNASAAAAANDARLPGNYRGNVFWDLPTTGHDFSECWNRRLDGPQCAARFLRAVDGGVRKGVIIMHDNMPQTVDMVGPLVDGLRARGMRIVHPRCIIGC